MELHSYAKRRTAKKWTIEQKRKLVEARINHDAIFVKEPRTSVRPWKKILTLAKLDDYNVFFVRKQWANLVSKYKAYKSRQTEGEVMQKLIQDWEFFQPIHLYMTRKTTNLHSYAACAETRKSSVDASPLPCDLDEEDDGDGEQAGWVTVSPTQYGSAFYSSDTNESRCCASIEQKVDEGTMDAVLQEIETDKEFYWHHNTTTGDTVDDDDDYHGGSVGSDGTCHGGSVAVAVAVSTVGCDDNEKMDTFVVQKNSENEVVHPPSSYLADTSEDTGESMPIELPKQPLAMDVKVLRQRRLSSLSLINAFIIGGGALSQTTLTTTTTNAATTDHQQPQRQLKLQITPVGLSVQTENDTEPSTAPPVVFASTDSYGLHSQLPSLSRADGVNISAAALGQPPKPKVCVSGVTLPSGSHRHIHQQQKCLKPLSERDKYYRHKRLFNRRLERRFDAILNVFGQVVRAEYPSIDVSPLLGAAAATGATINRLFSSDDEVEEEEEEDYDDDDHEDDHNRDGDVDVKDENIGGGGDAMDVQDEQGHPFNGMPMAGGDGGNSIVNGQRASIEAAEDE